MAEPLPSGWVDTGRTATITCSGEARVKMAAAGGSFGGPIGDPFVSALVLARFIPPTSGTPWKLGGAQYTDMDGTCPPGSQFIVHYDAWLEGPFATSPQRLERTEVRCIASIDPADALWSAWYAFSQTFGPFRLGCRLALIDPGDTTVPKFASDYQMEYRWFADESTQAQSSMAGFAADPLYAFPGGFWSGSPSPGMTPTDVIAGSLIGKLEWDCTVVNGQTEVEFRNLTVGGVELDTTGLDDGVLRGTGGGTAEGYTPGSGGAWAYPPYQLSYDVRVLKNWTERGEGADPGDAEPLLHTEMNGDITAPYTGDKLTRVVSWATLPDGGESFVIDAAWAAAQDPPWREEDRRLHIWHPPALSDPGAAPGTYTPVTVQIEGQLEVHRPDGGRPSDWVSSDTGKLTVSEGPTQTAFGCTEAGATATREFVESWRAHVAAGFGPGGDLGELAQYEQTNHEPGDDLWWWGLLTYLRVEFAAAPTALTLTVEGVHLQVDDTHETGSARAENSTATEVPYSYEYTLSGTTEVDLLFPNNATGPVYLSRVDRLILSGFAAGESYTISGIRLQANLTNAFVDAFLKCDFGPPVVRDDYSATGLALGGSWPLGNWGDQASKPDEVGGVGGNVRFVNIVTSATLGDIQDSQWSVEDFWNLLSYQEGVSAVYSAAAYEAANEDAFGNALVPELAQWTRPIVPYAKVTPSHGSGPQESYLVACAPHSGRLVFPNAYEFHVHVRDPKGFGGIEGIVWQDDGSGGQERAGNKDIEAYRTDTGARVAGPTGIDGAGYVLLSPVPGRGPGTAVLFDLREGT